MSFEILRVSSGFTGPCMVCKKAECVTTKYVLKMPYVYTKDSDGHTTERVFYGEGIVWVCSEECLNLWILRRM
jgi:hypothetical protein